MNLRRTLSVGDAGSLRGGVLWITPLQAGPSSAPVATAQGSLLLSEASDGFRNDLYTVETTARIPDGGILERAMATPDFAQTSVLLLRNPNLSTATRIAEAINTELGDGTAQVTAPGAVNLALNAAANDTHATTLAQIGQISVSPQRSARVIIDGRNGTVVAGGNMVVGEAVVSHESMTLVVGGTQPQEGSPPIPGDVRMAEGVSVQDVAAALHAVAAPPSAIGAVFESLREVGAIQAEVLVR